MTQFFQNRVLKGKAREHQVEVMRCLQGRKAVGKVKV